MLVDPDVYCFFYGPGHILPLSAYYFEVFHCGYVASNILMFKNWWWCFQLFFVSLSKSSGWLPYLLIITFSLATLRPVYNVTLVIASLSFGNVKRFFSVFPPLKCTWTPYLLQMVCSFHISLVNKVPLCDISSLFGWCCFYLGENIFL